MLYLSNAPSTEENSLDFLDKLLDNTGITFKSHILNIGLYHLVDMTRAVLKLINIFPFYPNQTGNMRPYYPFKSKLFNADNILL